MSWKSESLNRLFNPRSIAVIGASDKKEKLGHLSLLALQSYAGAVYPVNPRLNKIGDLACHSSVQEIGEAVDMAMIAVGPQHVLSAVSDCAEAGVGGAIIFSAGFKELGGIGVEHQKRVRELADDAHIAIIGPNCLGAGNCEINLNATFFPHPVPMKAGGTALVSQSGGVTGLMLYRAADNNLGVSKFASVGNRVNIDFPDLIRYLREDESTSTICLFVEGTEKAREMAEETRKTTPHKPILMYKVGKTPASREAALSHTGSLAGDSRIYSSAMKQARSIEVGSVTEMIDTAKILTTCRTVPKGNRVAVVTHTLGIALIAAQTLEEHGAILKPPSQRTIETIQRSLELPIMVPIKNPIDVLAKGWAEPEVFSEAFRLVLEEDQYDAAVIVFSPNFQEGIGGGLPAEEIVRIAAQVNKPVIAVLTAPLNRTPPASEILEGNGIPVFYSPQRAGKALTNVLP
jgi:acetyltransferase